MLTWIETNDDDLPEDSNTLVIGMWANKRWEQLRYSAEYGWLDVNGRSSSPPVYWSHISLPHQLLTPAHEQTDAEYLRDLSERLSKAISPLTDETDCDRLDDIAARLADDAGE